MGDHEDRRAIGVQLFQQHEDRFTGGAVEVPRGLVGQHDRRAADQRACDRDALALATGELARTEVGTIGEPHPCERLRGSLAALGDSDPRVEQAFGDVLQRGRVLRQEELLKDEPDTRSTQRRELAIGEARRVEARDRNHPRARALERTHHVQQRRLARARRAHDRHELTLAHREAHFPQRVNRRLGAVDLAHPAQLQHRRRHAAVRVRDACRLLAHDVAGTTTRCPADTP